MQPSTVYCDTCGVANRPQARFCIACGQAMPVVSPLPPTVQAAPVVSSAPPTVLAGPTPSSPSLTGLLPAHSLLKQRYLILSRLGQGGMGAVYKGADTQLGDRHVAVKEMSQKGLDPQEITEAAEAFKREALMLAGLFHRHLPRIYDHFADTGRWYLVMDFIAGETLAEYVDKAGGKLPVEEVLDIGIQLGTVLSYLHTHQPPIIFRDLKPANVMRTPEGDLFLIDFGIARHFKAGQAKDTVAYGSAGYAAPEQYGKAQTAPQSDIYSLGATLHHLLSGSDPSQSPFRFAPLSGATIPTGLGTLIVQMLDMDADKRPSSMAAIKQQLQRIAAQPAASQLPPTTYVSGSSLPPTQLAIPVSPPPIPVQSVSPKQPPVVSPSLPRPAKASLPLGTLLCTFRGHSTGIAVMALAWSPDGRRIASGDGTGRDDWKGTVQVWNAADGSSVFTYRGHSHDVRAVSWSPDGRRIASGGSDDNTVQVWNATDGGNVYIYRGHRGLFGSVWAVAWSPDGRRIASGSSNKKVQVWNAVDGTSLSTFHGKGGLMGTSCAAVAWSPDGRRIASISENKTVQVWNAADGTPIFTYQGHPQKVFSVAWSPNGRYVASGSEDKTVQVWDAVDGKHYFTYRGHSNWVMALAWSPDSKRIASASRDKTVQVWDAFNGNHPYTYQGHPGSMLAVAWSPDGRCIASGSADVQVWVAE